MSLSRFLPVAIAAPLLLSPVFSAPAHAGDAEGSLLRTRFAQQRVAQENYVLMAAPDQRHGNRRLVILEQFGDRDACWREQGNAPALVDPVMLDFDFRGLCDYRSNAGGYSIRVAGQDLNWYYQVEIVEHNGELLLLGKPERKGEASLLIGRSKGVADFAKIELVPGWTLTQRVYQGQSLKHLYLTTDYTLAQIGDPLQGEASRDAITMREPEGDAVRWNAGHRALNFGRL
jgi:hypothetical protein